MKKNDASLLSLFFSFAKVGVFTIGGGYAMLPMLQREIVNNKHYATEEDVMNYFAIGQCTPGIIAVNTATFIGYKKRGVPGGIAATLGVVFPSFIIITLLASVISVFQSNIYFIKAFNGVRVSVCALITLSLYKMAKKSIKSFETLIFALLALCFELFLPVTPIIIVIASIIYALVVFALFKNKGAEK